MNRAEQLADYLAGTLTPEEQAALTAELARDADLRAQLDAIRAADRALGQLSSPTPPAGFEERLDAALADELATQLGTAEVATHPVRDDPAHAAAGAGDLHGGDDELATRRARRERAGTGGPRWVTAVSGAAAALIVLAGAGVVFSGMLGGGDDAMVTTESLDTADDAGGAEFAEDEEAALQAAPADGPLLRTSDRDLDEQAAQAMLGDAEAFAFADRNLDAAGARDLAASYAQALGAETRAAADGSAPEADSDDADASAGDDAGDATDAPRTEALDDPDTGGAPLRMDPDISSDQRAQVGRCLTELLDAETEIVPVYAELTAFNDAPVILFGFVTEDPETGRFTRREVWIVDRASCQVQLFLQD